MLISLVRLFSVGLLAMPLASLSSPSEGVPFEKHSSNSHQGTTQPITQVPPIPGTVVIGGEYPLEEGVFNRFNIDPKWLAMGAKVTAVPYQIFDTEESKRFVVSFSPKKISEFKFAPYQDTPTLWPAVSSVTFNVKSLPGAAASRHEIIKVGTLITLTIPANTSTGEKARTFKMIMNDQVDLRFKRTHWFRFLDDYREFYIDSDQ